MVDRTPGTKYCFYVVEDMRSLLTCCLILWATCNYVCLLLLLRYISPVFFSKSLRCWTLLFVIWQGAVLACSNSLLASVYVHMCSLQRWVVKGGMAGGKTTVGSILSNFTGPMHRKCSPKLREQTFPLGCLLDCPFTAEVYALLAWLYHHNNSCPTQHHKLPF